MQVDEKLVRKIAMLARIRLTDEEVKNLEGELAEILTWVEQLAEVDTGHVEPLTSVADMSMKQRDDIVNDGGYPDDILKNAPAREDDFFVVPQVVE